MITPVTGEVSFDDGLRIAAHTLITSLLGLLPASQVSARPLPIKGWRQYNLGEHSSDFGKFAVEVVTSFERRVEGVFLSHCHEFYDATTPDDAERRVFHESVIAADLFGQREFPWGHVFCRLDPQANRDWLVVIYSPFSAVPLYEREVYRVLFAHEPNPGE
jgi:hypothetical protein